MSAKEKTTNLGCFSLILVVYQQFPLQIDLWKTLFLYQIICSKNKDTFAYSISLAKVFFII